MAYFYVSWLAQTFHKIILKSNYVALCIFVLGLVIWIGRTVKVGGLFEPVIGIHDCDLISCVQFVKGYSAMTLRNHELIALGNELDTKHPLSAFGREGPALILDYCRINVKLVDWLEFNSDRGDVGVLAADVFPLNVNFPPAVRQHELEMEQNSLSVLTYSQHLFVLNHDYTVGVNTLVVVIYICSGEMLSFICLALLRYLIILAGDAH